MVSPPTERLVILCVAASDAHVVANRIVALMLEQHGFAVVNLGACTPVAELVRAARRHPEALAVIVGSVNGHAYEDLRELKAARDSGAIACPVILGGNLSVGSHKRDGERERFRAIGVDHVLDDLDELVPLLERLGLERGAALQEARA